ncbi:MAG: hypothetical protein NVS3B24_14260 [Candidatus Dormibacteria bacterium]
MSDEQHPPITAPVYRQDEFVRRPTAWTQPMLTGVAIYFVLSPLLSLAVTLMFRGDMARLTEAAMRKSNGQGARALTEAQIHDLATLGFTVSLVVAGVLLLVFGLLAYLTYSKPRTWVFWVDAVLLALGATSLVSGLVGLLVRSEISLPAGANLLSAASGAVSAALLAWMVAGLVRFGPWAQEKVPATL